MIRAVIVRPDLRTVLMRVARGAAGAIVTVVASDEAAAYVPSAALFAVTTHVPARALLNTSPLIEHPALPADVTEYVTAPLPEPPVEVSASWRPYVVDVLVMVIPPCDLGFPEPTVIDCLISDAGANAPLPGSLKSMTQTPLPVKVTLPLLSEHPVDELLSVIATLSPEVTDAEGEYVSFTVPAAGGVLGLIVLDE